MSWVSPSLDLVESMMLDLKISESTFSVERRL